MSFEREVHGRRPLELVYVNLQEAWCCFQMFVYLATRARLCVCAPAVVLMNWKMLRKLERSFWSRPGVENASQSPSAP